jgi:hypothetical protein
MSAPAARIRRRLLSPAHILPSAFIVMALFTAPRLAADEPKLPTEELKIKELQKERLNTLREIVRLMNERFNSGVATQQESAQSVRMMYDAELELCVSDKDRVAVLEKQLAEAKLLEKNADQLARTGQLSTSSNMLAKADRLQVEIALARAKAKMAGQPVRGKSPQKSDDQVALAEKQVEIKQAAMQVAEAQKRLATAKLTSVKAQLVESQAEEKHTEATFNRMEDLAKQNAVSTGIVDEHRAKWEAAKARRAASAGKVQEGEAQVLLEQARIAQALREVEEAELRTRQLKANLNRSDKE